jgi:hypothetical protein
MASDEESESKKKSDEQEALDKRWETELEDSRKDLEHRKFFDNGQKALNVFMSAPIGDVESTSPRYNIYHRFVKVMCKTIYARPPKTKAVANPGYAGPEVTRAALIVERNADHYTQDPDSKFYEETKRAVFDYVNVARGVAFPRYEVDEGEPTQVRLEEGKSAPEGAEVGEDSEGLYYSKPNIEGERLVVEYINWRDYRESVSKLPREVRWRAKRTFVSKSTAKDRWGEKVA